MGVGGGYYDRILQNYQGHTVSLAFQEQIVPDVPIEAHDIPVGKIITNEGGYSSFMSGEFVILYSDCGNGILGYILGY